MLQENVNFYFNVVVGNRWLSGPALFFVCFLYSPLKNVHFISQAYHWNAPTVDDVTSTLSDLWPRVFPGVPLLSLEPLCLSSVSPPCCIVSLCRGFVWKSKPANAREQMCFVDLEELFVCHHQQKGRFYWLALWRLRDDDSESHSLVSAVVFHLWVTFFAWETKVCVGFASLWSAMRSLILYEGKSLVSPCAHCLPIQLHKVSSQVFDVTWILLSKIA